MISADTAAALHAPLTGTAADVSRLTDFSQLVRQLFVPAAATRLERAAQLLEVGLTGDVSALSPVVDGDPADQLIGGRLSELELEVLLPYLLARDTVTREPAFWAHIGSMLDLERLEAMADSLKALDLAPLVEANEETWTAARAALVIHAEDESEDAFRSGWRLIGRTLATVRGPWRVHVTADKRKLRGRDDSVAARWDELAPVLAGRPLTEVTLHGVQRRVHVTADQAADVLDDVNTIRDSIPDEFYVPAVTVRSSSQDDASEIKMDFKTMLADASPRAPVSQLVAVTTAVLGHRATVVGE